MTQELHKNGEGLGCLVYVTMQFLNIYDRPLLWFGYSVKAPEVAGVCVDKTSVKQQVIYYRLLYANPHGMQYSPQGALWSYWCMYATPSPWDRTPRVPRLQGPE